MPKLEILFFIKQCPLKVISGNKWWPKKVCAKLRSDLVLFLIFSFDIPLSFQESIQVVTLKDLMYFLAV